MDHLSFVFSLMLIVSVTTNTFGSAIKANDPNGEREIKEMLPDADLVSFLNTSKSPGTGGPFKAISLHHIGNFRRRDITGDNLILMLCLRIDTS